MNQRILSVFLLLLLLRVAVVAQSVAPRAGAPTVPEQVSFADISVQLDPDARRIIQQDVNALLANRQYWTSKLDRAVLYFPLIEAIFIDEDIPTDFKYLAVQESSLTPDAVSSSSAVGYWQFKRETAIDNGLRVDDDVDERRSITASTHGAAKYLKRSNGQFNNWVASLYSYYLGAGGITKLIPPDWSYAREIALDGRTDRYILRFFAHKLAIENALQTHQTTNQFALIEYPGVSGKNLHTIADELGVEETELRKYNRWVLNDGIPTDRTYVVAVPVPTNQINDVRLKIANLSGSKTPVYAQADVGFPVLRRVTTGLGSKNEPVLYEINGLPGIQAQAGDNAASLARKSKISLSSFLRYNDMSDRDPVIVNDVYYLAKKRKKALVPFHTVREGETARSISQRYGLRLKKLMRFNRLDRVQKLMTGRVMWLRERRPSNKPVEVINAPTPPVYDQTPVPTSRPDVVASTDRSNPRTVSGGENVPRNSSERRLYQPKLVDGGVTANDGTSTPAPAPRPVTQPTVKPQTNSRSVPVTSVGQTEKSEGSQRVVIVRTPEAEPTTKVVPVATTPERAQPTADERTVVAVTPKPKTPVASTSRPKPVAADVTDAGRPDAGRPELGRYEGPKEQQADGSISDAPAPTRPTKAPPRPSAVLVDNDNKITVTPAPTRSTPSAPVSASVPTRSASVTSTPVRPTPVPSADMPSVITHTVEPGQTYYSIAKRYGLSADQLLVMNKLTVNDVLEVGQKLIVKPATPSASAPVRPAATVKSASGTPEMVYHTVAPGETMYRISQQYGVSVDQLKTWNDLTDTNVKVGQKVMIMKK